MQFITLDQRIAVENFEVGVVYTVTFTSGDSFTGACIGIGPDFVAFQRTAPKLLFCLTMTTAADVASIEPLSADIGQILEYTGTVPISIKTNGSPLLDYLITGNTVQNGTPTSDNPIMPQGTGERTGNLLPEFYATSGEIRGNSYTITKNSIETHNDGSVLGTYYVLTEFRRYGNYANYAIIDEKHSFKIPAGTYTFSGNENIHSTNNGLHLIVGELGQTVAGATGGAKNIGVGQTFTINEDSYVCPVLEIRSDSQVDEYTLTNPMLNSGSTALPYEPFGVKIPISSADTTTPVYLGEVETTRRVKKYVFTGNENFRRTSAGYFYAQNIFSDYNSSLYGVISSLFSHYEAVKNSGSGNLLANNQACLYTYNQAETPYKEVYIQDTRFTTADEFNSYLAAQYAAGTPITVWYVLAEPTTGIVNEPLMRIGDYADTLSYRQSGINVPTTDGLNIFDIDTTIKPSEVYLKYFSPLF